MVIFVLVYVACGVCCEIPMLRALRPYRGEGERFICMICITVGGLADHIAMTGYEM